MAEPLPSASQPTGTSADAEEDPSSRLPANAEDRKAAAALNSLNANEISQGEAGDGATKQPSKADQEALGKAMSRLEIASGAAISQKKTGATKDKGEKKEVEVKKKIKVAAEDVTYLVDELDLTKVKATELLKAHDGDIVSAVKAFITPPSKT